MGTKLLWTGVVIAFFLPIFVQGSLPLDFVGAVIAIIGLVLLWLDK